MSTAILEASASTSPACRDSVPTVDEILDKVRALLPGFRQRADQTEENSQVPPESVQELARAGVFKMLQPRDVGGYEMNPLDFLKVVQEVGKGCASTGWVVFVLGVHNWEVALMGPEAVADVWGQDPGVLVSSSYVPFGKAEKVDGGYRLSGRWHYSSGADHAQWAILGAFVGEDEGPAREHRYFLVPRTHYTVDQGSWKVIGMLGSGSKDVVVEEVFVPDYRSHTMVDTAQGNFRGKDFYTSESYKYPYPTVFASSLTSAIIGMSYGMVQAFIEMFQVRKDVVSGRPSHQNPHLCRALGEADAVVRSSSALLEANFREIAQCIAKGVPVPMVNRIRYRSDNAFIARSCVNVLTELFRHTGARGTLKGSGVERFMRDLQVAANHISMNLDLYAENTGNYLLTGEVRDVRV